MKIRKQFPKQAESAGEPALLEGDKKFSRQISLETETGGRLLLGKSLFGDCSPRRKRAAPSTSASLEGAGHVQPGNISASEGANLEVHVSPVDQTTLESLEESNSGSCGDWTLHQDDHNNARRKYARRSLRSAGTGTLVVQSGINGYTNGKAIVAKVIQRRSNPSRGERRSSPSDKTGHPSLEPEGSLLYCLYLQLLAAGSEGMTLKEIFASFASQTRFSSLGSNLKEQVKSHLTSNPYLKGVKTRYFLCEELEPPPKAPKPPKAGANGRNLMDLNAEPRASRIFVSPEAKSSQVECDTPLSTSPDPSVVNNEREGVQTRRRTYERTIEAVLNESAVEFQKTQKLEEIGDNRSTDELSTASRRSSDLHMAAAIVTPPESATTGGPSKKRKSPVLGIPGVDIPEPIDFRHTGAVPGSLKLMQARIIAETGEPQSGARCSRKDGSNHHSKWQCPMMAMEGRSLCQHHNFLSERKKARYKKAKRQAAGRKSPPPRKERNSQERSSSRKAPVMTHLQDLNKPPRDSIENETDHSNQIDEPVAPPPPPPPPPPAPPAHRIVRTRSDANGSLAESATNNAQTTEDMDSETEGERLPLVKSRSINPATVPVPEPARQSFRSTRKPRMYLAAKKTAEKTPVVAPAPGKSVKKQSVPLIRPPSIPPLPMLYGVRRKSMKNRPTSQFTLRP